MITTLTLNPALDRTLLVDGFTTGAVNRVKKLYVDAGGKGINVSRIIRLLGGDTAVLGFIGGATGHELASLLDNEGIYHDFSFVNANTRINIKIVDDAIHTCTDINERGACVDESDLAGLKRKLFEYAKKSDVLVFSGSVPTGMPASIYRDLILELKKIDVKVALDTSGALLKYGISANPWLIKPNLFELSEIIGCHLENTKDILFECKKLIKTGIKYVCVTLGGDGLILADSGTAVLAKPPLIKAYSTVGAGDAACGSLALSLARGEPICEAARMACAVSAASVTLNHTGAPSIELIRNTYSHIEITHLE